MKIAISVWEKRVAPVFDVSRQFLIVDIKNNHETSRWEEMVSETELLSRTGHVVGLGVQVLICGAISRPLEQMLVSAGVQVIPHICGLVEEVLQAFMARRLNENMFLMPGCCGRRHRFQGGFGRERGRR